MLLNGDSDLFLSRCRVAASFTGLLLEATRQRLQPQTARPKALPIDERQPAEPDFPITGTLRIGQDPKEREKKKVSD